MSIYVFSTLILSIIFLFVFNTWWAGTAPFKIHLAGMVIIATTAFSALLMLAVYPLLRHRPHLRNTTPGFDRRAWGINVSSLLATPAAVIEGYTVIFANNAFLAELGMQGISDQILGMPLTNVIHPGDHQALAALLATPEQDKKATQRLRLLCLDGSILPVHISASPISEAPDNEQLLLQFSAVSSHDTPGASFREQFSYHLLVNQIEQVVFQVDTAQNILFLNPSWQGLLDFNVEDCLQKPLLSFIHPEDKPLVEARLHSLIQGKRSRCLLEARMISKNGDSHWVELRARNTSSVKGERSSVVGTLTDISHSKQAEASLRTNRRSLSMLINNAPCMIYRCKNDRNWSFEFVSDGCAEVTGYEAHEMINNLSFSYVEIIHPEDRESAWQHVQEKIAMQDKFQLVYRIITRAGHIKWVWEQGKGVYSSAGELLALEGFIAHISDDDAPTGLIADIQQLIQSQPIPSGQ